MSRKLKIQNLQNEKNNIVNLFSVVGITEEYDKFLQQLKKTFGWNMKYYEKRLVTKNRPTINEISSDVLTIIKEANQMDIELYEFVKSRL